MFDTSRDKNGGEHVGVGVVQSVGKERREGEAKTAPVKIQYLPPQKQKHMRHAKKVGWPVGAFFDIHYCCFSLSTLSLPSSPYH